MLKIIEK